mmetsp:Transcript_107392/g.346585  ORF Transcript_107392/g.346585 Transcript_107392/m.346585 type:complete len:312 (+) Transcript_107392:93-1028(+)
MASPGASPPASPAAGAGKDAGPGSPPVYSLTPWSVMLLGVYLPCYLFVLILTLFTYTYHELPLIAWLTVAISCNLVLVGMWPAAHYWSGGGRWDIFPLATGLLAVGLATVFGLLNYANMELWVHAKHLSSHNNVDPASEPSLMSDAGILRFADGTLVDVASSAGYRAWPHTYCAAPVVGGGGGEGAPPVGFWAVGINCCGSLGDFWCDGVSDAEAKAGLRIESSVFAKLAGQDAFANFRRAVRKAAAAQGLKAADNPVYLVWHRHPQNVAVRAWWTASTVHGLLVLVSVGICLLGRWIVNSLNRAKRLQRM